MYYCSRIQVREGKDADRHQSVNVKIMADYCTLSRLITALRAD
jgi:hypothetical protein